MMAGIEGLVAALRKQVLVLEDDLRARVDGADADARQAEVGERWRAEHAAALKAQRTAASWQAWRDERVTQSAVSWVLLTVFARYCEDHALVSKVWIAGPDADTRGQALDARRDYFTSFPEHTDREWLGQIAAHFAKFDATKGLVDEFSPLHQIAPSGDAARALLEFWWEKDASGDVVWSFTGLDTRFLGDVYQDLSEFAKKTYALLQTPEFVEEFILDQAMTPALDERPLEGFTIIDPTCGSGHFLLGAFQRLLRRWELEAPGLGRRALAAKALESIYGVDVNPFAVAIARFRLLVAALDASGDKSIEKPVDWELNLATGDSLLWGARQQALDDDLLTTGQEQFAFATDNAPQLRSILQREHDVVVGNPPYITVKDKALNSTYRSLYATCHRKYALTVPFMELFFHLAYSGKSGHKPGWVGQITSNSFMKREFGSKLIEDFLWTRDLRRVIDTSGAYIPGHGTPTVILIGRNHSPVGDTVRAVLGIRGEPGRPAIAAKGVVWSAIAEHVDEPKFENGWISVADLNRAFFRNHPWSLSGGGAVDLLGLVEGAVASKLRQSVTEIGFGAVTAEDSAFMIGAEALSRKHIETVYRKPVVEGDAVRDWDVAPALAALWPYSELKLEPVLSTRTNHVLWPFRTILSIRVNLGQTQLERGLKWFEYSMFFKNRYRTPLSITFAFVATHNHFVLDRGGKVFNRSAPVIKLPEGASEDDHLKLLGVLNSSVACFWLKQNSHNKGDSTDTHGARVTGDPALNSFEFTGTTLKNFPLPSAYPLSRARALDELGQQLATNTPAAVATRTVPTAQALEHAHKESERIRGLMIAHQEELDWETYRLYGLLDADLTYAGELPEVVLGERAFEIVLARTVVDGEDTAWFERHRSTPVTAIPSHFPADFQELLQRRLDVIASNPGIRLLEKPENKRRWAIEPWDKRVTEALRDWLLDRVEDRALWFDREDRPTPHSVAQLADLLDRDENFCGVLRLWAQSPEASTSGALKKLLADEGVPFLAAYRYKPAGLEKRAAWENTWNLQRREDKGVELEAPIPVPPKYKPTDFAKTSYWSRRGKLDVPKERFIAYPHSGRASDPTDLLGWAGWDHAEQGLALAGLIDDRIQDGVEGEALTPLLAGLVELLPWVQQWHSDVVPEYGASMATIIEEELRSRCAQAGVSVEEAAAWKPVATVRGRAKKKETPA